MKRYSQYELEKYKMKAGILMLIIDGAQVDTNSYDYDCEYEYYPDYDITKDPKCDEKTKMYSYLAVNFNKWDSIISLNSSINRYQDGLIALWHSPLRGWCEDMLHHYQQRWQALKVPELLQKIDEDEKFLRDHPPLHIEEPEGAAAGGPYKALIPGLPKFGVVDPTKQLGFDQMVAKIKQIDIAISKGQAVRKKEYLKGCFNEVLNEVKSHKAELLNHNLDVPACLRKSQFIQDCTHLNADADLDTFANALCLLGDSEFDAIIH